MEVTYYDFIIDNFDFVFENIENDSELYDSEKDTFFEFINNHKIEASTETDEFLSNINFDFFFKNQFVRIDERGQIYLGNLGHIVSETKFYEIVKQNTAYTSPEVVESKHEFLDWFFDDFEFEFYQDILKDIQIGRFMMWSFQNDKSEKKIFSNLPLRELACILGLDDKTIKESKIAIEHSTTEPILKPTFFDAGINELWIPGGITKPRDECTEHSGLREFVHKPNVFQNIINRHSIK